MTNHFLEVSLFLSWLLFPILAYFVYVLYKALFRRGKEGEAEGTESEA